MKKGIPCTHLRTISPDIDRITYRFVTDNGNTPAECTVCLGSEDPLTGERLTDIAFFRDYARMENRETYYNLKYLRPNAGKAEQARRKEEKEMIRKDFEQAHGYAPNSETIRFLQEEKNPGRYLMSLDSLRSDSEEVPYDCLTDLRDPAAEDAFPGSEPWGVSSVRAVEKSLEGRLRDVFEMMIRRSSGSGEKIRGKDLARKWNVSEAAIVKDEKKIARLIRERIREEEEDRW